jgi:uncharacterized NAD(P)/FAD-binding protein YdhS
MLSVAIVGSGPSAIYTLQALRQSAWPYAITVFEAGAIAGFGTPYDPRTNAVSMLANIASIEVPPVDISLLAYLESCDDAALALIGVERNRLGEREFYPRIALGAYYRDRLAVLVANAAAGGHEVKVLTRCRVVDVIAANSGIDLLYQLANGPLVKRPFDKVVLATGHLAPTRRQSAMTTSSSSEASSANEIGVLGSSLSAVDMAVSLACERGTFSARGYQLNADAQPFVMTFLSRGGRLPEVDFYCPLPTTPADGFTAEDVSACARNAAPGHVLDLVFARFAATIAAADPSYAARIDLDTLTIETFANAYFAERDAHDAFAWARQNLEEARHNRQARYVVAWRYTILRCHEAFSACLDTLHEPELARFNAGMKRVFADNYAAVPPLSIERLINLHDAGALNVAQLADDYELTIDEDTGRASVTSSGSVMSFDCMFDARGQAAADEDDFPFPTLRMTLKANNCLDDAHEGGAIRVDDDYRLTEGVNPLRNVWCMSIPFLLGRKPFIQGLTSASQMGEAAAAAIIADREPDAPVSFQDLLEAIETTLPMVLADGVVVLAPLPAKTA